MLMMGEAGPRDIARAAKLLDAACTANAPNACDNMGVMLMNGMNGPADFGRAGTLLRRACALGSQSGCFNLGQMLTKVRSEEHTYEIQSLMRNSYAVFRLKN